MTDANHQPPPGDTLDRAAAAVRGQAIPAPPADLAAAVGAAVSNRLNLAEARARRRRWIVRGISVGGLATCAAVVALMWGVNPAAANELLAEALANQKPPVAVKWTVRTERPGHPPEADTNYQQGKLFRFETRGTYGVHDGEAGRSAQFFPASKTVMAQPLDRVVRQPAAPNPKDTAAGLNAVGRFAAGDRADGLTVEALGERPHGGRTLPAYRVRNLTAYRPRGTGTDPADATYWVDPAIKRVVREVVEVTAGPMPRTVTTDIDWLDAPLDPALFNTDLPAGWAWFGAAPPKPASGEKTRPVGLLVAVENQQKAKSFRAVVRTTPANAPAGSKPTEQRLFGQGAKARVESGDLVSVVDGEAGKLVLLDAKAKVARVGDEAFLKGGAGHPEVAEVVKKLLAKEGAEDLGERFLDGRKVHTYRVKGLKLGEQTMDVTYTVDARKELPVRVEHTIAGGPVAVTQTIDYLGFDEELDPKLFDLSVPAGYKREELKLPAAKK